MRDQPFLVPVNDRIELIKNEIEALKIKEGPWEAVNSEAAAKKMRHSDT